MKALIFCYAMILFYFFQATGQMIAGVRYYPVSPWFLVILNAGVAVLGLYGYRRNRNEKWVAATSIYSLPLALLGVVAGFYSYPICILSFYIAITNKGNKIIKRLINTICMTICALPVLGILVIAVISPMGFLIGLSGRTTIKEYYSPDKRYVAVVKITEAAPAGGTTKVSVGRYLDWGIWGRYLPNRSLYDDNGTELPDIVFSEEEGRISINGISYEISNSV